MRQLPCVNIDSEIRSLVHLLNKAPYIQTHSSCSGHPMDSSRRWDEGSPRWREGWIAMVPIEDFSAFWRFLNALHIKLNLPIERPFSLFQQIHAEALFASTVPLIDVYCNFTLGVDCQRDNQLRVWNLLVSTVQEFLQEDKCISVKTVKEGADTLIQKLHSSSHVQLNRTKFVGRRRVVAFAVWRYDSCKWCLDLVEHVNNRLGKIIEYDWLYGMYRGRNLSDCSCNCRSNRERLFAHALFGIRPVIRVRNLKRTREEHVQIWRLTELIAASLMEHRPVSGCSDKLRR